jgi:hypothetical protein
MVGGSLDMTTEDQTSDALIELKTLTFLSYNRNDSGSVREIEAELRQRGVDVWLDESNLAPGARWQNQIARALERAVNIGVCIGRHGLGGWQKLELQLALAEHPEQGKRIVPILLPDAPRSLQLPPYMACDLRGLDRATQLDNLAAVLLADIEWPARAEPPRCSTARKVPSWLHAFFQSAGKSLVQHYSQLGDGSASPTSELESVASDQTWDVKGAPRS